MTCNWTLENQQASLEDALLAGKILSSQTELGLHRLCYQNEPLELTAFQLSVTGDSAEQQQLEAGSLDCFVRECDLVATYPETSTQPFSAQVYWRAWQHSDGIVGVDLQLSLQTTLLESFPQLLCKTVLPASEAHLLVLAREKELPLRIPHAQAAESGEGLPSGVLVRPQNVNWSYLECIQAADDSGWTLDPTDGGRVELRRLIGGDFQEKGVIRRFRLRACFLPRQSDLVNARNVLEEFAEQPLPLTV